MYRVTVRDHFMIAHSFSGEVFGPAQGMHGATYTVDVTFRRPALDDNDLVVDIALAGEVLASVLGEFHLRNLDEIEEFEGRNTTTEFMARVIFERMAGAIRQGRLGEGGAAVEHLEVVLHESHVASAGYEGRL
jgi:6-pyruvoyl-tetrahydropterin synthase